MADVELLNTGADTILDLTGGAGDAGQEDVGSEGAPEEVGADTSTDAEEGAETGQDSVDAGSDTDSGSSDSEADDVEGEPSEYFFGDAQVTVEVPDEISSALKDAEIDEKELLGQLFKKDGGFQLEGELREKLDAKFGKLMVDGYLNMYRGLNDQAVKAHADKATAEAATLEQYTQEYAEAVGGQEGLDAMEDFILSSFDEKQIASYNAIMESGDHDSQMLIINAVRTQMALKDKLQNGDKNIKLVGDESGSGKSASPLDKGYLTADEYQSFLEPDSSYWTDNELSRKVDAARKAGFHRNV